MVSTIINSRFHLAALIAAIIVLTFAAGSDVSAQPSSGEMTGYAWSDTIGWISLSGSTYGISVASGGALSGYAWSDNIGWVSANAADTAGCPASPCAPTLSNTGELSGWLKALAGGTSQSGGWDGWIHLKGTGYGPVATEGVFSGYAWGSDVVGWVDFSYARTTYTGTCDISYSCVDDSIVRTNASCATEVLDVCTAPRFCSAGSAVCLSNEPDFVGLGDAAYLSGHLSARPTIVARNSPSRLYWNVENVESCTVSGTNGQSWNQTSSSAAGVATAGITQRTTFTLTCERLDSGSFTESVIVNLVPVFNES